MNSTFESDEYERLKEELDSGWPWPLGGVQDWFESLWNTVSKWVYDAAKKVWDWLPSWIRNAITFLRDLAAKAGSAVWNFFKDPIGSIKGGLSWVIGSVKTAFDGAFNLITGKISELLGGIINAFSEGFRAVIDWLVKHLTWLAEMIWGAVVAVVNVIKGAIEGIIKGFINAMIGMMSKGSPEPEMAQTMNVMIDTAWTRQIELIKEAYKSPPNPGGIMDSAIAVAAVLGLAGVGSIAIGIASDAAHPFKDLGIREAAADVVGMVGIPSVLHSIMTMPTACGLLIPLRYGLMDMFQPMQPGSSDIVRFAVRECFDPRRLETLLAAYPGAEYNKAMAREGYSSTWAKMYWGAHWVLPSISQLNEYLYRHDDFVETWRSYVRYNDVIPEAIPWLEEVIYAPYTRVDIRRMWDMRVVTEGEVYTNYRWLGYDDEHAKRMTLWTKIYTMESELRTRYSKGWITQEQVKQELLAAGMPSARADEWVEKIVKAESGERIATERDLTKAEIIKGWKVGILDDAQAIYLLRRLGYEEWEAEYLLAINVVAGKGHPEGYWEMRRVVEAYRKAQGLPFKVVPDILIDFEKKLGEAEKALADAKARGLKGAELGGYEGAVRAVKYAISAQVKANQL